MNEQQKNDFKKNMQSEIEQLKKAIKLSESSQGPVAPGNAIGRLTRMEAMQDAHMRDASLQMSKERVARLERALERVESPVFGLCVRCKKSIPVERLMIVPEATICVPCSE